MPEESAGMKVVRSVGDAALSSQAGAGTSVGLIEGRTECVFCRYDLAGMARNGTCPECGREVRLTAEPDWIRHSNRTELAALRNACVVAWVVPLYAAAMVVLGVVFAFTATGGSLGEALAVCLMLVGSIVSAISTFGWGRLLGVGRARSAQDPTGYRPGAWGVLCVVAGLILTLAGVTALVGLGIRTDADWAQWVFLGGYIGVFVGGSLHIAFALGGLARRFQSMHLARLARWTRIWGWCSLGPAVMFACAFLSIVGAFSGLLGGAGPTPTQRLIATIGTIGVFTSWIPSLAALIGGGIVVNRFRRMVERALRGRVGDELAAVAEPARTQAVWRA